MCQPDETILTGAGTRGFRSPQISRNERVNPMKADIFAFAVTCFMIRFKSAPFGVGEDGIANDATDSYGLYEAYQKHQAKENTFEHFFISST